MLNTIKKLFSRSFKRNLTYTGGEFFPLRSSQISGKSINASMAMQLAAVLSCVTLISETIAGLPLILYRHKKNGGKEKAFDHPLFNLLKNQPNSDMTSFTWRETAQGHILLQGNKFNWIERARYGVKSIWPIHPSYVEVKKINRQLVYYVQERTSNRIIPSKDMLHVPGFGFNGLTGESVITNFAKGTIGIGLSLEEFQSLFFEQGMNPGGVFYLPEGQTLGDNAEGWRAAVRRRFQGGAKHHVPMTLENGMKFDQVDVKLVDAQFLDLVKAKKIDICGIFKVPPSKISIHGTNTNYNNTEQENLSFVNTCLLPWLVRDEQAMNAKLLTDAERKAGFFIKYNVSGLLRGDSKARSEYYNKMFQVGAMSPNDIREKEDANPIEGGDQYFVPLNFVSVDRQEPVSLEQNHKRIKENRSQENILHSVRTRDRIIKRYYPLFENAVDKITRIEKNAVTRKVDQFNKKRAFNDLEGFLHEFYSTFDEKVKAIIAPTFRVFAESIQEAAATEIGDKIGISEDLEKRINDYINGFSNKYVRSSLNQLLDQLKQGGPDAVADRATDWTIDPTRAQKTSKNETVSMANMVARASFLAAGFSAVWAIRGDETCPYCRSLEGMAVKSGQAFVEPGNFEPEGADSGPMKIRGLTKYPALHGGCDCFITYK